MRYPIEPYIIHQRIPGNDRGVDWFVGDIHGQLDLLKAVLGKIEFDKSKDRLFAVGDLIDRGPQSIETLDFFLDNEFAHSVWGNHEWCLREELLGNEEIISLCKTPIHGAAWRENLSADYLQIFVDKMDKVFPLLLTVDQPNGQTIGVIHASPPDNWQAFTQGSDIENWTDVLWDRRKAKAAYAGERLFCHGVDAVVCGHHTFEKPVFSGNIAWIDAHELTIISAKELLEKLSP